MNGDSGKTPDTAAAPVPDPAEIAEQFLDLWQQQLAAVATDDTVADTIQQLTRAFFAGVMPPAPAGDHESGDRIPEADADDAKDSAEDRAASGGAAPVAGGDELVELRRRVAELEERLARLESGAGG